MGGSWVYQLTDLASPYYMQLHLKLVLDSASLTPIALTATCLCLMGLIKIIQTYKFKAQSL